MLLSLASGLMCLSLNLARCLLCGALDFAFVLRCVALCITSLCLGLLRDAADGILDLVGSFIYNATDRILASVAFPLGLENHEAFDYVKNNTQKLLGKPLTTLIDALHCGIGDRSISLLKSILSRLNRTLLLSGSRRDTPNSNSRSWCGGCHTGLGDC